jgi:hypothetical protein
MFGDSFAGQLIPFLAHRARRLVRVHASAIDRDIVFRERPDVVLSVTVERFLRAAPPTIADFSYRAVLRKKLADFDAAFLHKTRVAMRNDQSPRNAAYAADVLWAMPSA